MAKFDAHDGIAVSGFLLLIAGVVLWSIPAALVVAGVLLLSAAWVGSRPPARKG